MTAASIAPDSSSVYAQYLEGKASPPARGDYYLGRDGLPTEAPGRWRATPESLARLGIDPSAPVARADLEALMEGRHPGSSTGEPEWLRRAGSDGRRAAGIDVTLSAPKSVSVAWALSGPVARAAIEQAHSTAVGQALGHLVATVPVVAVRQGRQRPALELTAQDLLTAEFVHTTARGVKGAGPPDPQLHSHCVVTSAVRRDGQVVAVRSRPVFRAAREVGAYYRAALAWELRQAGYEIETGTGKDGRYFELVGIDPAAREAFSKRAGEVQSAADEFRARTGRDPERGELRAMKMATRQVKVPTTRGELQEAWEQTARQAGLRWDERPRDPVEIEPGRSERREWADDVERGLTRDQAIFTARELRAGGLEQAAGRLPAQEAIAGTVTLTQEGRVLELEDQRLTTRTVRDRERLVEQAISRMSSQHDVLTTGSDRHAGVMEVAERLGGKLSDEQLRAVEVLAGPERAAVLVGPAGTGKGVVIDAVSRAERHAGRSVYGVAVSGSTAERLGRDSPGLEGRTMTVDGLITRLDVGALELDDRSTVIFDEAGMADTERLHRLVGAVEGAGAKLVLVGDARQLASIGPGGLFARIADRAPTVELEQVRRTRSSEEQQAWAQLRAGDPVPALAHYQARGQLHMADTRPQALEATVRSYDVLARLHGHQEVALMTDGPNTEIDHMNHRVQRLRHERGELGAPLPHPDGQQPGFFVGDRLTWTQSQPVAGQRRVENGTRGTLVGVRGDRGVVQLDATARLVEVDSGQQPALRLAYAQHLYRQQGATVDRAVTLTGGWQTTREGAYVQASRARHGIDWHVAREQLGTEGTDSERVDRLAEAMQTSGAQVPSTTLALMPPGPGLQLQPPTHGVGALLAALRPTAPARDLPDLADRDQPAVER